MTPRFRIHYHEGLTRLAHQVADIAEASLDELVALYGSHPETPIHVVITDETDTANGFASVLPENIINLYPAVPEPVGSLGDYDDSMRLLFIHELTHIVHLDTIGGIPAGINAVFGKIWSPNQIQPRWFIEGIAVYTESRLTSGGRVRNALIDMYLRADILADKFLSIDELTTSTRRFPGGELHWSYGGRFLDFIARHHGSEALAQITHEYGARLIPYALNLIAKHATGKTFLELWDAWKAEEETKALELFSKIEAEGERTGELFAWDAEEIHHPAFGPNGELAFLEVPRDRDGYLVFLSPDLKTRTKKLRTTGGSGAFSKQGDLYVSALSDAHRQRFQYADLELIDPRTGARRRRTYGARVDEPDVSIDREIIAVHQEAGETELVTMSLDGDEPPDLFFRPPARHRIFSPRYSPDGQSVVASLQMPEGGRRLIVIDRETSATTELTNSRARDNEPKWSADGAHVYFSSDRGGVYNIYRVEVASKAVARVSNVPTGALEPAVHPNGKLLAYRLGVYSGYELRFLELDAPPLPADVEVARPEMTDLSARSVPAPWIEEEYTPWETLLPKRWSPSLSIGTEGWAAGVLLEGSDAIDNHAYQLNVEYNSELERLGYSFFYSNRQLPTGIFLTSSLFSSRRPGSFVPNDGSARPEAIFRVRAGMDFPFSRWDAGHGFSFSYGVELRRGETLYSDDPFQPSPSPGDADTNFGSFNFAWRFSNVRSFADSNSAAAGHALSIGIDVHDPKIGSDFRILSLGAVWSAFYTLPWLSHHVIATRLSIAGAAGDARGRSVYTLGGLEARNLVLDAIDDIYADADVLRGYPPQAIRGNSYYLLTGEYRFPLFSLERGIDTLPVYFDRAYAAAFIDAGDTPADKLTLDSMRIGVGGELRVDLAFGYYVPFNARIGYARGLSTAGVSQLYAVLGGSF